METIKYVRAAFAAAVIAMSSTASASADLTNNLVFVGMYEPMGYTWCSQSYYDTSCHDATFIVEDGSVTGTVGPSGTTLSTHSFSVTYTSNQIVISNFTGKSVLDNIPDYWVNGNTYFEIRNFTTSTPIALTVNPSTVATGVNNSSISYSSDRTILTLNSSGVGSSDMRIVLDVVSTVPEPTSAVMLLGGLGLIGAIASRNRISKSV
jgi:hypothetical protein